MTQEDREGFKKSNPYPSVAMNVDENTVSQDKKPSPELFEMIQAAASSLTGFAQLWESIRKKGNSEGFTDEQLQWLLRPLLQNKLKMSNDRIYYLFHKENKLIQKNIPDNNRKSQDIVEKKEPEQTSTDSEQEAIKEEEQYEQWKKEQESKPEEPKAEIQKAQQPTPVKTQLTLDEIFESLPDDQAMTCWKIDRIAGNALKNRISAWQGNSTKIFRVWMQEVDK
jgi:hypothetical protein